MAGTTVAPVLDAIRDLFRAAIATNIPVIFGPPTGDIGLKYVCVAHGGDDRPGVAGSGNVNPYANRSDAGAESYTVWCLIEAGSGDQDQAAIESLMSTVNGLFDQCATAIRTNANLGGLIKVGSVDVAGFEWAIDLFEATTATIIFAVSVDNRWV